MSSCVFKFGAPQRGRREWHEFDQVGIGCRVRVRDWQGPPFLQETLSQMLFQHSHPAGSDAECATPKEGPEGFSDSIPEEIQRESHSVYLDQRARTLFP